MLKLNQVFGTFVFGGILSASALPGHCATFVDNTANVNSGNTALSSSSIVPENDFTTGPAAGGYTFQSVGVLASTASGTANVTALIRSGSAIGPTVGTFTGTVNTSFVVNTLTSASPITLNPTTTYFFLLQEPVFTNSVFWGTTANLSQQSSNGFTIADNRNLSNAGLGGPFSANGIPTQFLINVPFEFSPTLGLSILGGLYAGKRLFKSLKNKQKVEA